MGEASKMGCIYVRGWGVGGGGGGGGGGIGKR